MALSTNSSLNALPPIPIDPQDFIGLRFFLQALEDQVVKAINPNPSIPTGVTGLKVTAMNLGNLVAWNQSTNSEGYIVWRNISNNFTTATIIAQLAGIGNATAFDSVDQTAANQTRYYWVAPFNGNGIQGPLSAAVSSNNFAGDPTSTFVGVNAKAAGVAAVAVGQNSSAPALNSTVVGQGTVIGGVNDTIVGQGSSSGISGSNTVVGQLSSILGPQNVIVGQGSSVTGGSGTNTIVGQGISTQQLSGSIVAGQGVTISASVNDAVIIGRAITVSNNNDNVILIGRGITCSGVNKTDSIGIGNLVNVSAINAIAIGSNASVTTSGVCVIGSNAKSIADVYIGHGGAQSGGSIQTTNIHASDGYGSNIGGDSLALYGGKSTGNAAGGNLDFYTTPAGGAGSTLNTATLQLRIDSTGLSTFTTDVAISSGKFTGTAASGDYGFRITSAQHQWVAYFNNTASAGNSLGLLLQTGSNASDYTALFQDKSGNTLVSFLGNGAVAIGSSNPAASTVLDLQSTTGALLVPRMTTTQKNALTAADGMIVYDTTLGKFQGREGGAWSAFSIL